MGWSTTSDRSTNWTSLETDAITICAQVEGYWGYRPEHQPGAAGCLAETS